jgi:hypothetical protein
MRIVEVNIGKSIAQLKGRFAGAQELKQKAKSEKELAKKFVPLRNKAISAWYEYQAKILTTRSLNDADVTKQEKQQMYKQWAKGMFPKTYTGKVPNMFTTKSTQAFVGKEVEEFLKTKMPKTNESFIREDKNLHLEHAEDLIFDQGYDGAVKALKYIDAVVDVLEQGQGKSKLTVKWDGAPAIFAGIDPDDGKFFVGTKGVFNTKEPKMVKSKEDLSQYGDGLAKKLGIAFEHLKDLGIGNVLQGDLLFTEEDVKLDNIGGEPHYVFNPNTITYAVPADSDLGERIAGAKMGIVFHTTYTGETRADMQAAFGADVNALTRTNSVWFDDATMKNVTGTATLTDQEQSVINKYIANVARLMETISKDEFDIITSPDVGKMLKIYMNQRVRGGQAVDNPEEFIKGFVEFYTQRLQKEIDGLKSGNESPAAQRRMEKIQRQEQFVQQNMPTLVKIVSVYKGLIDLKTMLVKKLNKLEGLAGTFIKTDNGYRVTDPEGFVAINGKEAVKLVDRLEFSKENFNAVKNWN